MGQNKQLCHQPPPEKTELKAQQEKASVIKPFKLMILDKIYCQQNPGKTINNEGTPCEKK